VTVRPATPADADFLADLHKTAWGGSVVVAHGVSYDLTALPTLIADGGALVYDLDGDALEVVSLVADPRGHGAGTQLLEAAKRLAPARLWLVTTNDNLDALRFYQRRGLRVVDVSRGAVDRARALKPSIPLTGEYGIELHDELVLEYRP
jgi:GNAT superfamily N-acetyltransferase